MKSSILINALIKLIASFTFKIVFFMVAWQVNPVYGYILLCAHITMTISNYLIERDVLKMLKTIEGNNE